MLASDRIWSLRHSPLFSYGIKEGVIEAMKGYSYVKTFRLPW